MRSRTLVAAGLGSAAFVVCLLKTAECSHVPAPSTTCDLAVYYGLQTTIYNRVTSQRRTTVKTNDNATLRCGKLRNAGGPHGLGSPVEVQKFYPPLANSTLHGILKPSVRYNR